jgi:Ferritin-like domain
MTSATAPVPDLTDNREQLGVHMDGRAERAAGRRWTRARLLRGALGGGALVAGGVALGRNGGMSVAAPSKDQDAEILGLLLLLERVQESFYEAAVERARLRGELLRYATTVGRQEREHVAFLEKQLGGHTPARPQSDFGDALSDQDRFRKTAIELEEATLAAYIGQGGNLTRPAVAAVAGLISVEARQVAWLRDLAGVSPAPNAADPAREPEAVLSDLRERGYIE